MARAHLESRIARGDDRPEVASPHPTTDTEAVENRSRAREISPWLKGLVLFHIVAIVIWALPKPKDEATPRGSDYLLLFNERQLRPSPIVQGYLFTIGAWQYWDMFAPDPSRTDIYGDAEVELADGSKRIVGYPRMFALNLFQRYTQERFRKFYERAGQDTGAYLWPSFAAQLGRVASDDPRNPPRIVTLRRHWLEISPPGVPQGSTYNEYAYFRYVVQPEDLATRVK